MDPQIPNQAVMEDADDMNKEIVLTLFVVLTLCFVTVNAAPILPDIICWDFYGGGDFCIGDKTIYGSPNVTINESLVVKGDIHMNGNISADSIITDDWYSADSSKHLGWKDEATGYLSLDGDGDYVNISPVNTFNATNGALSAWVYMSAGVSSDGLNHEISGAWITGNVDNIQLFKDSDDGFQLRYRGDSTNYYAKSNVNVAYDDTWIHLLGSWNETNGLTLYVNGIFNASAVRGKNWTNAFTEQRIGNSPHVPTGFWWDGYIDEFMAFNCTPSDADVLELYDAGRDNKTYEHSCLMSWWQFNKDFADSKGDNDGTAFDDAFVFKTNVDGLVVEDDTLFVGDALFNEDIFFSSDIAVSGTATFSTNMSLSGQLLKGDCGPWETMVFERGAPASNQAMASGNGDVLYGDPVFCAGTVTAIVGSCEYCNEGVNEIAMELRINNVSQICDTPQLISAYDVNGTSCNVGFDAYDLIGCYTKTETGTVTGLRCKIYVRYD